MKEDFSIVVARHGVPIGENGLSPLQQRMTSDPAPVRVFSAPTGAGKSYAFIKAASEGRRVLFIVPTRRLAQNLAQDAASVMAALPQPMTDAVGIWTSDETARKKADDPDYRSWQARVRQVRQDFGSMPFIVATPESVAGLLIGHARSGHGADAFGTADLIQFFDDIVFDEFHTIDARGFGLCAVIAKLYSSVQNGPKVTFLSATPIEIVKVMRHLSIPAECISVAAETVDEAPSPGKSANLRVLHGDIRIAFETEPDMVAILERNKAAALSCIERGRQIVIIFDGLADLHANRQRLGAYLDRIGIPVSRRLAINSIDDSTAAGSDGLFAWDARADPRGYDVLVATSSIEMGVTFRAGMIVMDPGHDAGSFVQRVGRVARGDEDGLVIVRRDPKRDSRRDWLRMLADDLGEQSEGTMPISRFLAIALRPTVKRFEVDETRISGTQPPADFKAMPERAVWAACVFWYAMEQARPRMARGQARAMKPIVPRKVWKIASLVRRIRGRRDQSRCGTEWADRFIKDSERLREFAPTMTVKEPDRVLNKVPLAFLDRYAELQNYPLIADEKGGWTLTIDRKLGGILSTSDSKYTQATRIVLLPNGQSRTVLAAEAVSDSINAMRQAMGQPGATKRQREIMGAAINLVRLSGMIPSEDTIPEQGSAVF